MQIKCLVCERKLSKENVLINIENYTYLKCDNCLTLTCDPLPPSNVIVYGSHDDSQWRHYVDIGAGIDSMCGLLPTNSVKYDLVDIGCGFGFTLDYWNFIQNRNASIGFDESFMSVKGKEFLNVDLELPTSNLSEFLKNRSSDLVIASEVIEHVISPYNFLKDLLTLIKQNNCKLIILTTPSSEFLLEDIENVTPTKLASLSPGFHTCILSIKALELILKNLGIDKNFYKIERRNERLIIKISKTNKDLHDQYEGNFRDLYIEYLKKLSQHTSNRISDGANYRLFKEEVNSGNFESANIYRNILENSLKKNYNINIYNFKEIENMEKIFNKTFEEHTKELPAWFGPYLFYSSQCYRGLGFPFMQREILLISKKIMELYVNRFPNFGLEAFDLIDASLKQLMENQNFIITRLNIFSRLKFTNKVLNLAKNKIKIILETLYKNKFR